MMMGEKMRDLGQLAEENRLLLKRAMRVQSRVLDLVAKAARNTLQLNRYGAGGKPSSRTTEVHSFKARV